MSEDSPIVLTQLVRRACQRIPFPKGVALAISACFLLSTLVGCSAPQLETTPATIVAPSPSSHLPESAGASTPSGPIPTSAPACGEGAQGLTEDQVMTLCSLQQVDDYPLYVMHYFAEYEGLKSSPTDDGELSPEHLATGSRGSICRAWGCSLFAALGDPSGRLYGRSFDWEYSAALLLFTDPPDGYGSVSMVDIAFLGFDADQAYGLMAAPWEARLGLLGAPLFPFDGLNEAGLAIGMAAVPAGGMRPDPAKDTVGSLEVIRLILDHAGSVNEAVAILGKYNVRMEGGLSIHYLVADSSGHSALIEFYQGRMVVIHNREPWQAATNFLLASTGETGEGICQRFDLLSWRLAQAEGQLSTQAAFDLLEDVSTENTQWSVVYDMTGGEIDVAMGREYSDLHAFRLPATVE